MGNFYKLFCERGTDLTRVFKRDTGVITLTSLPTSTAAVVRIKGEAEVARSGLFLIRCKLNFEIYNTKYDCIVC